MNTIIDVKHHISDKNQQISQKDKFWRRAMGFTLVELMVTIAVMVIIATMAAPSFIATIRKAQLNSDTQDLVNLLSDTRSEALLKVQNKVLSINSNTAGAYKNWQPSNKVLKKSGDASVTFDQFGRIVIPDTQQGQCFILAHVQDNTMMAYVYVQKTGRVIYDRSATGCPTN